ncbi:9540_t:CDS:1 [Scutellospora calospora]|uniref:9540_t:CDS:1 n=1 Tax=Scutellospora calospora TaxID=85575 RepID=A0ACA9M7C3_9GLOM|nr:9540_t:CDS:1 [Scutellospora calospora]
MKQILNPINNQKKKTLDDKEQKNELFKLLRKINLDITKTKKEINIVNGQIARLRINDERVELNKYINILEKKNTKLTKDRDNTIKKLIKLKETLESLLKRKYINKDTIKEIEKISSKSTTDFTNNKGKTIKDKRNSTKDRKQKQLSFFQKQLKTCFSS